MHFKTFLVIKTKTKIVAALVLNGSQPKLKVPILTLFRFSS